MLALSLSNGGPLRSAPLRSRSESCFAAQFLHSAKADATSMLVLE